GPEAVGLGAAPTDHDARARGVHVDAQAITRALDLDPAHRGALELTLEVVADLPVLDEALAVLLVLGEPPRLPVGGDAEAEPVRVDLLSHYCSASWSRSLAAGVSGVAPSGPLGCSEPSGSSAVSSS